MKLINDELRKLWSQTLIKGIFIGSLILSLGIMFISATQNQSVSYTNFSQLKSEYDQHIRSQAILELEETIETTLLYQDYSDYISTPDTLPFIKETYYHDEFLDESFLIEYHRTVENQDLSTLISQYQGLLTFYQSLNGYQSYIQDSVNVINNLKNLPFWESYSEGRKAYYDDLLSHYEVLKDVTLSSQKIESIEVPLQTNTEILMIAVGLILFLCAFDLDASTQMNELLLITKKGRHKTTVAKIIAASLSLLFINMMVQFSLFMVSQSIYGFIDWSSPMQAFPSLYYAPYNLSILEWTVRMILGQYWGVLVLSLSFCALYHLFINKKYAIALFSVLVGLSAILYFTITDTQAVVLLRYLNVYAITQARETFRTYGVLELFNSIFLKTTVLNIVAGVLGVISIAVIMILRVTQSRISLSIGFNLERLSTWIVRPLKRFGFEVYKLLIMQKGLVVMILALSLLGNYYYQLAQEKDIREQDQMLVELYKAHGGTLTKEKVEWIESEALFYTELEENLKLAASNYRNDETYFSEYMETLDDYISHSQEKRIFTQFYTHYTSNMTDTLVYPSGYQALFSMRTETRDLRNAILIMLVLIFVLSPIVAQDKDQDQDRMYTITKMGNRPLTLSKAKLAFTIAVAIVLLVFMLDLIVFSMIYNMNTWDVKLIAVISENLLEGTIPQWILNLHLWQYAGLILMMRIGIVLVIACIIFVLSSLSASIPVIYIASTAILFLPLLIGNSFFDTLSVHKLLMGNTIIYNDLTILNLIPFLGIFVFLAYFRRKQS